MFVPLKRAMEQPESMSTFTLETEIEASKDEVWALLADFGGIHKYMSRIIHARLLTDESEGIGVTRHCDLEGKPGKNFMVERVTAWDEGKLLRFSIDKSNAPMSAANVSWRLTSTGSGTRLMADFEYQPKFGPLGWVMDKMMMRRMMKANLTGGLSEIKAVLESGQFEVTDSAVGPAPTVVAGEEA